MDILDMGQLSIDVHRFAVVCRLQGGSHLLAAGLRIKLNLLVLGHGADLLRGHECLTCLGLVVSVSLGDVIVRRIVHVALA